MIQYVSLAALSTAKEAPQEAELYHFLKSQVFGPDNRTGRLRKYDGPCVVEASGEVTVVPSSQRGISDLRAALPSNVSILLLT